MDRRSTVRPRLSPLAGRLVVTAAAALLSLAPAAARAQSAPAPGLDHCAAPDSALTYRDTVYVYAVVPDSGARVALRAADRLAARVALRMREMLGGGADSLPYSEPAINWRNSLGGYVEVTERRGGRATWRQAAEPWQVGSADTAVVHLLSSATDTVARSDDSFSWPGGVSGDSLTVDLKLETLQQDAISPPGASGKGTLVFLVRRPLKERPERISGPWPRYPEDQKRLGIDGHVVMQVVIDTAGQVEPATITARPSLDGQALGNYLAFVEASREALRLMQFRPGRIGGCRVRMRVLIPFNYTVTRG